MPLSTVQVKGWTELGQNTKLELENLSLGWEHKLVGGSMQESLGLISSITQTRRGGRKVSCLGPTLRPCLQKEKGEKITRWLG